MKALKAQGISRDSLPYKAIWQPWLSYYGVFFNVLIILTQGFPSFVGGFDVQSFFVAYISVLFFGLLYMGHKLYTRCPFVKSEEVDLDTGRKEVDEMYANYEEKPRGWFTKICSATLG